MKQRFPGALLLLVFLAGVLVSCGEDSIPVTGLEISPASIELLPGGSAVLTAVVKPENATDKAISWLSTSPETVSVYNAGNIKSLRSGNVTITARCGGISASCLVSVIIPVESIALDKTEITLRKGESATLTATVSPSNATVKTATWTSSDPGVVSIDANGSLQALRQGKATVTATCSGISASCQVNVRDSASGSGEDVGHENWN